MSHPTRKETIARLRGLIAKGQGDTPVCKDRRCPLEALWGRKGGAALDSTYAWVWRFIIWADRGAGSSAARWSTLTANECLAALLEGQR